MSLSAAFSRAHSIFSNASEQFSTLVKNIENSGNKNYVRREVSTVNIPHEMTVVTKKRVQDHNMFQKVLDASSSFSGQQKLLDSFESLKEIMGCDNDYNSSPAHYIGKFQDYLQTYANNSSSDIFGRQVIESAVDVVNNLKSSARKVQKIRTDADKEIDLEISHLRQFLDELTVVNNSIKSDTSFEGNANELLDRRDSLLQQISEIIGISTVTRRNNDIVVYTSSGSTLFETLPRDITFLKTESYSAAVESKPVFIDGIMVSITDNNVIPRGKIEALLQIRDGIIPTFQSQLDEISRGFVNIFYEKDPNGHSQPVPGLFIVDGLASPSDKLYNGMSELICINPKYQSNPYFLRDGGSSSPNYQWNPNGFSGYSDLINSYRTALNKNFSFDSVTGISANTNLLEYGRNSIGWLEKNRSNSHDVYMKNQVAFNHISDSYSNYTGVNLQEELSFLMQVEQSYNISNKLMNSINSMMNTLLEGIR
ncbi:MAG: flagellar hook-associated protein FlgK [Candidatus Liberibacter europaeus]|nr:flagellar hook-associated protein FlgK [Candidatus Liberibacter europaeus]